MPSYAVTRMPCPGLGFGFDAVGVGDAASIAHGGKHVIEILGLRRGENSVNAIRGKCAHCRRHVAALAIDESISAQLFDQRDTIGARCDG